MKWIKAAIFMGVVAMGLLVTGVRTVDKEAERKMRKEAEKTTG